MSTEIEKIDEGLKKYYKSIGKEYDKLFSNYCDDNGFDEDALEEELQVDPSDCLLVDFDDNFPFKKQPTDKVRFIFDLILKIKNNPDISFGASLPIATCMEDQITKKQIIPHNIYLVEGYIRGDLDLQHYQIYIPQEIINLILYLFSKSVFGIQIEENIEDIANCVIDAADFIKMLMQQTLDYIPFKLPFELDLFIPVDIITTYNTDDITHSTMLCDSRLTDLDLDVLNINYPYTLPCERIPIVFNSTKPEAFFLEQDQYCTLDTICKKVLREFIVPTNAVLYSTADQLRCKLMVFTFNVEEKDRKIHTECSLILNEKLRFYGKDIIGKLSEFFLDNEKNKQFIEEEKQTKMMENLFDKAMEPFDAVEKSGHENKNVVIHYGNKTIIRSIETNENIKAKIQRKESIPIDQEPCIITDIECDNGRILFEYDSTRSC